MRVQPTCGAPLLPQRPLSLVWRAGVLTELRVSPQRLVCVPAACRRRVSLPYVVPRCRGGDEFVFLKSVLVCLVKLVLRATHGSAKWRSALGLACFANEIVDAINPSPPPSGLNLSDRQGRLK